MVSFIGGGNWRTRGKSTDLLQVTDKLDHIMFYSPPWSRFELTTTVAICTDCIGSCKFNYHTITIISEFKFFINALMLDLATWKTKWVRVMVFNATFNNISIIWWQSVLLVEETRVHVPTASHWPTLSHNVVSSTPRLSGKLLNNQSIMRKRLVENLSGWKNTVSEIFGILVFCWSWN